jgi:hypothetical protein
MPSFVSSAEMSASSSGKTFGNNMAAQVRTLVPNGQTFIARWNFRRAIRDGSAQFPKGVCTVGVGGPGAAILFGQVLGALLEKFVRHRGNSQSLSFDFA